MSAAQVASLSPEAVTIEERSPFQIVMTRFKRHRLAMVSLVVMTVIFIITILAPVIAPFTVQELSVNDYFVPWGAVDEETGRVHYLGTDHIGRDYFSRLIYAGRISLTIAIVSVIISEVTGIVVGAVSGFFGGVFDIVGRCTGRLSDRESNDILAFRPQLIDLCQHFKRRFSS